MAKWRALHGAITVSPQVIRMTEFEQLLFTWMIPHADDWGVISGDPLDLKVKVMPASDRPLADFGQALARMEELGLIHRYEPDGEGPLIQFPSWDDLQPIRENRRDDPKHTLYANCQAQAGHQPGTSLAIPYQTIPDQTRGDQTIFTAQFLFPSEWQSILIELQNLHDRATVLQNWTKATGIVRVTHTEVVIQVPKHDLMTFERIYKAKLAQAIGVACPDWAEREVILLGEER